jgi:hypothetical protein
LSQPANAQAATMSDSSRRRVRGFSTLHTFRATTLVSRTDINVRPGCLVVSPCAELWCVRRQAEGEGLASVTA